MGDPIGPAAELERFARWLRAHGHSPATSRIYFGYARRAVARVAPRPLSTAAVGELAGFLESCRESTRKQARSSLVAFFRSAGHADGGPAGALRLDGPRPWPADWPAGSLGGLALEWLAHRQRAGCAPDTLKGSRDALRVLVRLAGDEAPASAFTPALVEAVL